jgi:predicted Kef-type K+ transport protein
VEFLQSLRSHAVVLPNLAKFAFGMLLIVGVPPLCRQIRLPAVVGLVLTGTFLGPHVIGLFGESHPIAAFLADLGKLLLMFVAGLEIDLARFRQAEGRSIAFGILTTSIPVNQEGQRLLDRSLLNVVFVLMLTTSILGPILTERLTPRMLEAERMEKSDPARGAGGSRLAR